MEHYDAPMQRRVLAVQAVAIGVALGVALTYLLARAPFDTTRLGVDMDAYWGAAVRIREGLPLYPPLADVDASGVFRYPAWFALAWVPLTLLPHQITTAAWVAAMFVGTAFALTPALRSRSVAGLVLALLMAPLLLEAAWLGNIEPLMVAGLVWGLGTRGEVPAIALAAATKLTPIAFIAIPLARRDMVGAAATAALVGVLLIPNVWFDASMYPADVGGTLSLWLLGPPWWAAGALVSVAWLAWAVRRRSRFVALIAAISSLSLPPRLNFINLPQLLAGNPARDPPDRDRA